MGRLLIDSMLKPDAPIFWMTAASLPGLLSTVNSSEKRLPLEGFSRLITIKRVVLSPSALMSGTSTSSP